RLGSSPRHRGCEGGCGVTRLDRPVISVGNLSTGGTGKTPMVHLIINALKQNGHHPAIAMRGYGAKPGEKGDEQREHELALPGVPIVAQPNRLSGLSALFATSKGERVDCVVLDDGFQHRKIARELDIVLIDATRPPNRDALLPRGHLREPIGSLSRAGLVILTHAERVDVDELRRIEAMLRRENARCPILRARHVWAGCTRFSRVEDRWESESMAAEQLRARRVRAVCGIGNPDAFRAMLVQHGLEVEAMFELPDHAKFGESDLHTWISQRDGAEIQDFFMTRKDWVKAAGLGAWPVGLSVIVPELAIDLGDDLGPLEDALNGVWASR
ncbi:unnamed protein product, partial [Laminaria digitata]